MEEALEAVAVGDGLENIHHEHVVVCGDGGALKEGRHLELAGSNLVVAGQHGDADLEKR